MNELQYDDGCVVDESAFRKFSEEADCMTVANDGDVLINKAATGVIPTELQYDGPAAGIASLIEEDNKRKMAELQYNDELHTYSVNGEILPNVTEILKSGGLTHFDNIPTSRQEESKVRGSYVHLATELYDKGTLNEDTLDSGLLGYLAAWKNFKVEANFKVAMIEQRGYSEKWRYAGTWDRTGLLNNKLALLDIKSGKIDEKATRVQTAAYLALAFDYKKETTRYAVQLKDDGTYQLSEPWTNYALDFSIFLSCLKIYRFKNL